MTTGEHTAPGAAGPLAVRRSPWWPTGASTVVGVIGHPVAHSLSPLLHNAAFDALGLDWASVAFPVPPGAASPALDGMRALGIAGLSVTMPHKEDAWRAVDRASEAAARLRAVNCVTREADGTLSGDSTDGPGLLAALRRGPGFDPAGRRCAVLGAGGAARAIVLALAGAGAAEVLVVNRTPERARAAADLAGEAGRVGAPPEVAGAELVVQATPVGMAGRGPAGELPPGADAVHEGQVVVDIVVHPLHTAFLTHAAARGARTVPGLGMLVHQAVLALERWTGRAVPAGALWRAASAAVPGAEGRA